MRTQIRQVCPTAACWSTQLLKILKSQTYTYFLAVNLAVG